MYMVRKRYVCKYMVRKRYVCIWSANAMYVYGPQTDLEVAVLISKHFGKSNVPITVVLMNVFSTVYFKYFTVVLKTCKYSIWHREKYIVMH